MIGINELGKIGRLGNQMFQYASVVGIAKNNNLNFLIPDHSKIKWIDYEKDIVKKKYHQLQHCFEMKSLNEDNLGKIDGENYDVFWENKNFDEDLYNKCPDNINIRGYLENYGYFIKIENTIRNDFTFKKSIFNESLNYFKQFDIENPVCIIVRRGDYINHNSTHPLLSMNYYKKSITFFGPERKYLIVSDDIDWCKEHFIGKNYSFVDYTPQKIYKGHFDMCVGSLCSDFIISNSTFAWWTSWLSKNLNKKICAPANWFHGNNKNLNTDGYYLDNFIKINNKIINFNY
jgi:hypothetical protein